MKWKPGSHYNQFLLMAVGMGMTGFLRVNGAAYLLFAMYDSKDQVRMSVCQCRVRARERDKASSSQTLLVGAEKQFFCNILGVNPSLTRTSFSFFYILEFHLNLLCEKY